MKLLFCAILLCMSALANNAETDNYVYTLVEAACFRTADVLSCDVLDINSDICRRTNNGKVLASGKSNVSLATHNASFSGAFNRACSSYSGGMHRGLPSCRFKSCHSIYQLQCIRI